MQYQSLTLFKINWSNGPCSTLYDYENLIRPQKKALSLSTSRLWTTGNRGWELHETLASKQNITLSWHAKSRWGCTQSIKAQLKWSNAGSVCRTMVKYLGQRNVCIFSVKRICLFSHSQLIFYNHIWPCLDVIGFTSIHICWGGLE